MQNNNTTTKCFAIDHCRCFLIVSKKLYDKKTSLLYLRRLKLNLYNYTLYAYKLHPLPPKSFLLLVSTDLTLKKYLSFKVHLNWERLKIFKVFLNYFRARQDEIRFAFDRRSGIILFVTENSDGNNKHTGDDMIRMLEFLVKKVFVD